jgi:hypothetical protein
MVSKLPAFFSAYPDMAVEMAASESPTTIIEDGFDLAIHSGDLPDSTLFARRFAQTMTILVATPQYLTRFGAPESPEELKHFRSVVFVERGSVQPWSFGSGPPFAQLRESCRSHLQTRRPRHCSLHAPSSQTVLAGVPLQTFPAVPPDSRRIFQSCRECREYPSPVLCGRVHPESNLLSYKTYFICYLHLLRRCEWVATLTLDVPFLEPSWNMDHEIVNKTPNRRQHSPRRRVNQVQNILRPRPFRQHPFNKPLF